MGGVNLSLSRIFETRDELSFGNIRFGLWPLLLALPLSVIMADLCSFDMVLPVSGLESHEVVPFCVGLGWLLTALMPRRCIVPALRIAAVLCAVALLLQFLLIRVNIAGEYRLFTLFIATHFLNAVCFSLSFSLFCFELNNVERLSGMVLLQFYLGINFIAGKTFPAVAVAGKPWVTAAVMALFLVVVFACGKPPRGERHPRELLAGTNADSKGPAFFLIIILDFVFFAIAYLVQFIEWAENSASILSFTVGSFLAIAVIFFVQLISNRNALYIWLLFMVMSLLGLGALLYDSPVTLISGSFCYGLGSGLGYIIIYYIIAGIIRQSRSFKLFRFYCALIFFEDCIAAGILAVLFKYVDTPNKVLSYGIVLVLCCICIFLIPLMQKKLFETDWSDGLHLQDLDEFAHPLEEAEAISSKDHLSLTPREQEVFTMLLLGKAPKEVAYTLKISYDTVCFHQKNLYRKLGIQSRAELFAKWGHLGK